MTRNGSRVLDVDALRGFALFGIIAVNVAAFADPWYATLASNPDRQSLVDVATRVFVSLIFETKFYLLFSFLFGYSFTLQMEAASRASAAFVPRMVRRQFGLFALGALHGAVLFFGDILMTYAVLGMILLALRRVPDKVALWLAGVLVVLPGLVWLWLGIVMTLGGVTAAPEEPTRLAAFSGGPLDTLAYHSSVLADTFGALFTLQAPSALAAFLIGLVAGRRGLLADPPAILRPLTRFTRRWALWGALGAICYSLVGEFDPDGGLAVASFGIDVITAPLLTVCYVTWALLWFRHASAVRNALAPAGRMAATNYVAQSLALGVVFTGYGFGLVNQLPPIVSLAVAAAIFVVQLYVSRWWLTRFTYGPVEWVLRWITVAKRPAFRIRSDAN